MGEIYVLVECGHCSSVCAFWIICGVPFSQESSTAGRKRHVGQGTGNVGLVTALLLSGLDHFLSLCPSFLLYKPPI